LRIQSSSSSSASGQSSSGVGVDEIVITSQAIATPVENIPNLGHVEVAEQVRHTSQYYLKLWNEVLKSKYGRGRYSVVYSFTSEKAKIISPTQPDIPLIIIDCSSAEMVKAQYVIFRIQGENFTHYSEYLNSLNTMSEEDVHTILQDAADVDTPPEGIILTSEQIEMVAVTRRRQRRRHNIRNICGIM